jgi:hypothetical protein
MRTVTGWDLHSPTTGSGLATRWSKRGSMCAEALPLQWAAQDRWTYSSHPLTRVACPPRGGLDFHLEDYPSGMWGGARLTPSRLHIPVAGAPSGVLGAVQVRLLRLEPSLPTPCAHTYVPRARGVAGLHPVHLLPALVDAPRCPLPGLLAAGRSRRRAAPCVRACSRVRLRAGWFAMVPARGHGRGAWCARVAVHVLARRCFPSLAGACCCRGRCRPPPPPVSPPPVHPPPVRRPPLGPCRPIPAPPPEAGPPPPPPVRPPPPRPIRCRPIRHRPLVAARLAASRPAAVRPVSPRE